MIKRGRTHMFCRAIDSRRSVMEGKDETENEGRGEQEIFRRLVVRKFFYIISIPYSRLVSTTGTC